jgi:hypothetical protein
MTGLFVSTQRPEDAKDAKNKTDWYFSSQGAEYTRYLLIGSKPLAKALTGLKKQRRLPEEPCLINF